MAIKNTNTSPLLKEGANITLTQSGQVITIAANDTTNAPGGSDTQVQFNDGGNFGGDAGLTYNKTTNVLGVESIDFAQTPAAATAERRLNWDQDEGSLVLTLKGGNVTIPIGHEVVTLVYNAEATTLTKGTVVYAFGAQGQRISVKRAVNTGDATSAQTIGVVAESIASGAEGWVMVQGMVRGLDTSAYVQGDALYLGATAGTYTNTKPYAPNHLVYVGIVVKVNASSGEIFVRCQNGYELDELHNVSAQSPSNNDGIFWNSSTNLWEKKSISTALGYTPAPASRMITINGTSQDLTADRTWSVGTVTSVGLSAPTGFSVANSPVISSGTLALSFASGYSLPTNTSQTNWDTAYTNRITSLTTTGSSGAATLISNTLNIPNYTLAGLGGVPTGRTITINGTAQDLSADRTYSVGTVTSIATSAPITGGTITGSGTIGITQASGSSDGYLSSTDWTTFNNKQNALTNPITGTGASGQVAYFNGTTSITSESNLFWDASNDRLGIGTASPAAKLDVIATAGNSGYSLAGYPFLRWSTGDILEFGSLGTGLTTWQQLRFLTNNTERIVITSGGNVGIGTPSPSYKLSIQGSANNENVLHITNSSGTVDGDTTNQIRVTANGNSLWANASWNAYNHTWQGNGSDKMKLFGNTGNLYIGSSPSDSNYKLDVNGTGRFSDELYLENGKYINFKRNSGGLYIGTLGIESGTDNVRLLTSGDFYIKNGSLANLVTVTNAGNLGLGVTPSAWSGLTALQIKGAAFSGNNTFDSVAYMTANAYYNGTNFVYIANQQATRYEQDFGQHKWYYAAAGTGNITFTQAMTLDASGNLGIGIASPAAALHVNTSGSAVGAVRITSTTTTNGSAFLASNAGGDSYFGRNNSTGGAFTGDAYATVVYSGGAYPLNFYTNDTKQMQLTANGDLIIGSGADTGESLQVTGDAKISQALKVQNYSTLSQTVSGAMTILGHNVISDPVTANKVTVLNSGWYSSMIKMYYSEGITFHSSNTSYNAGDTFYLQSGTTNQVAQIKNDGQLKLNNYTSTTSFTGTAVGYLAFENDGDIITRSPAQVLSDIGGLPTTGATISPVSAFEIDNTSTAINLRVQSSAAINLYAESTINSDTNFVATVNKIIDQPGAPASVGATSSINFTVTNNSGTQVSPGYISTELTSFSPSNGDLKLYSLSSGSNISTLNCSSGIVKLPQGQLEFPSTQNASANSNTLDDYEEGNWTPAFGNTGASITYATNGQVGSYTKIGRQVTCYFRLQLATSTMSGNSLTITSLPFTSANVTNQEFNCTISWQSTITTFVNVQGRIAPSSTTLNLYKTTSAATLSTTGMVGTDIGTNSIIFGTLTYFV